MNELQVTERQFREIFAVDATYWTRDGGSVARQEGVYARPLMSASTAVLGVIGVAKQAPSLFREAE